MINFQLSSDKTAIGLSVLCVVHCLLLPVLLLLLPSFSLLLSLQDEVFHLGLLVAIVPISLMALIAGCRKHKNIQVFSVAVTGLLVLIFAAVFGHDFVGEVGEVVLTIAGSLLVMVGHFKNYQLGCKSLC